jgi:hypothetical protein
MEGWRAGSAPSLARCWLHAFPGVNRLNEISLQVAANQVGAGSYSFVRELGQVLSALWRMASKTHPTMRTQDAILLLRGRGAMGCGVGIYSGGPVQSRSEGNKAALHVLVCDTRIVLVCGVVQQPLLFGQGFRGGPCLHVRGWVDRNPPHFRSNARIVLLRVWPQQDCEGIYSGRIRGRALSGGRMVLHKNPPTSLNGIRLRGVYSFVACNGKF